MCGSFRFFLWEWDGILVVQFLVSPHTSLSSRREHLATSGLHQGLWFPSWLRTYNKRKIWSQHQSMWSKAETVCYHFSHKHVSSSTIWCIRHASRSFVTRFVLVLCFYQTYLEILFVYIGKGVLDVRMDKPKLSLIVFCIIVCRRKVVHLWIALIFHWQCFKLPLISKLNQGKLKD